MPQMKVETRYCSELRKTYAPETNCVTFEIRDESSPENSPPQNEYLQNGQLIKSVPSQDTYDGSKHKDKISSEFSINPDLAVSDLGLHPSNIVKGVNPTNIVKGVNPTNIVKGVNPTNIVNGAGSNDEDSNANEGDIKSSLFSDSSLSNSTCKPNKEGDMKIIKGCDTQVFEDASGLLPSISIPDQGSKGDSKGKLANFEVFNGNGVYKELNKSTSDKLNNSTTGNNDNPSSLLLSISCTVLSVPQQNSSSNTRKQNGFEIINAGLLDILPTISFDETDTSPKNSCKSSLNSSHITKGYDSNKLISDFSFLNSHTNTSSNWAPSKLLNNGSLSDMLSSINLHENHKTTENEYMSTTLANQNLESDSLLNLKELSTEFLGLKDCTPKDKSFSFSTKLNDASDDAALIKSNVDDRLSLSSAIDTLRTTDPINSFTNGEKNDFSFFSISPDNVFHAMLANLHANSNQQNENTEENTDNISMLELLKSVNTDSSSSLSEYLDVPSQTKETSIVNQSVSDELSEILDIDLSGCVKASENADNLFQDLPVNDICMEVGDTSDVKLEDSIKPVFERVDSNRPRVNKSQSLFAKALSCKPKRNTELLRKAFYVKSELYKLYFNRELPANAELDKNFKVREDIYTNTEMVVCKTNSCMITFKGRRFCPYEVN